MGTLESQRMVLLSSEVGMNLEQQFLSMTEAWKQFLPSQERIEGKFRAKMGSRSEERLCDCC